MKTRHKGMMTLAVLALLTAMPSPARADSWNFYWSNGGFLTPLTTQQVVQLSPRTQVVYVNPGTQVVYKTRHYGHDQHRYYHHHHGHKDRRWDNDKHHKGHNDRHRRHH